MIRYLYLSCYGAYRLQTYVRSYLQPAGYMRCITPSIRSSVQSSAFALLSRRHTHKWKCPTLDLSKC